MPISLQTPIKPGDVHIFRIPQEAFIYKHSIDYIYEGNILIHIKPILEYRKLVVNDFIGGSWREELHIPLSEEDLKGKLDVFVTFYPLHAAISLGKGMPLVFRRGTPLLETTEVRFSQGFEFSTDRLTDEAEILPRLPDRATASAPSSALQKRKDEVPLPNVAARIHTADIMHIAGELTSERPLQAAYLLILIDGRESGSLPVEALAPGRTAGSWHFQIEYRGGALVGDGMTAELVLERGKERHTLDKRSIRSQLLGGLDRCSENLVRGWACNPKLPGKPMLVDVFLNDRFQGSARCDRHREDLLALGERFAGSGFVFKFPQTVFLPESSDTAVSVRFHNTDQELMFSPWWICRRVRLEGPAEAVPGTAKCTSEAA